MSDAERAQAGSASGGPSPPRVPLRFRAARVLSAFWRFRTLPRARRIFRDITAPCLVARPFFGYRLCLDVSRSDAHRLLYLEGERFIAERRLLSRLVRPGMRVVDVGANIGYYMLMFERFVGPAGSIVCIEPSPPNVEELERNVSANGLSNVSVHRVAVGGEEGMTGLRDGINSGVTDGEDAAYEVPLRTLDSLLDEGVDFLKIDVEGYEAAVLQGAQQVLARDRPALFVEFHPHLVTRFGSSLEEVLDTIRPHYGQVACYELSPPGRGGALRTLAVRYLVRDPVERIGSLEALARECAEGRRRTFWIVAGANG